MPKNPGFFQYQWDQRRYQRKYSRHFGWRSGWFIGVCLFFFLKKNNVFRFFVAGSGLENMNDVTFFNRTYLSHLNNLYKIWSEGFTVDGFFEIIQVPRNKLQEFHVLFPAEVRVSLWRFVLWMSASRQDSRLLQWSNGSASRHAAGNLLPDKEEC